MTAKIEFETDNAAFEDGYSEVVAILREVADKIENGVTDGQIRDTNGNKVGKYEYKR